MGNRKYWSHLGKVTDTRDTLALETAYADMPENLYDMFSRSVSLFPEKNAFICDEVRMTYSEACDKVDRIATGLVNLGVNEGDRVALLLDNCVEFVLSFFAAARIGAVSVVLNTRLESKELEYIINDSGPVVLIVHKQYWGRIEPIRSRLLSLKHCIMVAGGDASPVALAFETIMGKGIREIRRRVDENDLACIIYTSGTTGRPKGAMITHRNIIVNSMNCQRIEDFQADDVSLIMVPLFHVTGLFGQLVLSVFAGGTCVILRRYKTDRALALIEKERVSFTATVPTILWMMMKWPDFKKYDLRCLTKIMFGGSPSSDALLVALSRNFPGAKVCEGFGMTEATVVVTLLPPEDMHRKLGSAGLPLPYLNVKIVDEEDREVDSGQVGELCLKGPTICQGYWGNIKNKETFKQGWLHTGDLAKMDEEGYIYIMGRQKEMIIRGGENVYCVEVENVLYGYPKVLECALIGVPDEFFGEEGKAVVVLKTGESATQEEIRDHCRKSLADFKVPKHVEFVSSLPRNPGGKVMKTLLAENKNKK